MSDLIVRMHNTETNETTERPMTAAEKELRDKDHQHWLNDIEAAKEAEVKKAALLEKLGITAEEAKLLLS